MKMKKMIAMFLLVHFANIDAMSRRFVSKLPVAKYSPETKGFMPKELQTTPKGVDEQFYQWLRAQDRRMQDQIYNHGFIKDYAASMPNFKRSDSILDERVLVQREILQYVMDHPEETKDIFDFYQNMKLSEEIVEGRLSQLPKAARAKFDEMLQKCVAQRSSLIPLGDDVAKITNVAIKYKILRLHIRVVLATFIAACMVTYIGSFLFKLGDILFNYRLSKDQDIIEVCTLLADALDVDPPIILEYKAEEARIFAEVFYAFGPRVLILHSSLFFSQNIQTQIQTLLHEFRHIMQTQNGFEIPADVIEYAQLCGVGKYSFSIEAFWRGLFFGECFLNFPMLEFDAEHFAITALKDSLTLHEVKTNWHIFDPRVGYWSDKMAQAKGTIPKGRYEAFDIEEAWENFLWQHSGQNVYLKYLPQGIKDAAAKNRAAKTQEVAMEQMYERAYDAAGF